jgi:hypothetical protein
VKIIPMRSWLSLCLAAGLALPAGAAEVDHPGFVDGSAFLELAGEESGTVEVRLQGALLRALLAFDPELKELTAGLESIHAVVLETGGRGRAVEARDLMRRTEKRLLERGWERLARVKDQEASVSVLVLAREDKVDGLVVMVTEADGEEIVFANIAGTVDLAAIARLGESLDIPGLDKVGD